MVMFVLRTAPLVPQCAPEQTLMASKPKNAETEAEPNHESAEGAESEGAAAAKKKFPLKLIIIAAAALAVIGGGGGAYFLFSHGKTEHVAEKEKAKPVAFMDLPDVVVNLANAGNERAQYLKVKITLELPDQTMVAQVQPVLPRVVDAFQTYLRELRPTDLDGSAGLYRLKEELTRRVNASISPSHVNAVLFKEIVVQ
jgi:flagellar FliL protein